MDPETAFFHVTARGNAKQAIFIDAVDYLTFLRMLEPVLAECAWLCHAYCLMPNHYHLLIQAVPGTLPRGMHLLNGRYARRFNVRHTRVGHVFQGPYHSEPVERDEHFLETCRYLALNPVRARLCVGAADWPWSSYRASAGLDTHGRMVEHSVVRGMLRGVAGYRAFVDGGVERLQPG